MHAALILDAVERKSDLTFVDLRAELAARRIGVSIAGLWRFFARRKITLKKSRRAAKQDGPDILKRCWEWLGGQLDLYSAQTAFANLLALTGERTGGL